MPGGLFYTDDGRRGGSANSDHRGAKKIQTAADAGAGYDRRSAKRPATVCAPAILHRKASGGRERCKTLDMVHTGGRGAGDRDHNGGGEKNQRAGDPENRLSGAPADRQKRVKKNAVIN